MKPPESNVETEGGQTKRQLLMNVIWISVSFFLLFTGNAGLQALQSSINCDSGLGVVSLSANYLAMIFSALFLPAFEIKHLGLKWTVVINIFVFNLYTVANFYPTWTTMLFGAVIMGIAAGPLWAAHSTYVTTSSIRYAKLSGEPDKVVVSRSFGIFFFIVKWSSILGNLFSSLILKQGDPRASSNSTETFKCGIDDCYTNAKEGDGVSYCDPPSQDVINTLLAVFLATGLFGGVFGAVTMSNISNMTNIKDRSFFYLFFATTRLMRRALQASLIPISIFSGLQKQFFFGEFTKSFVTCTIGVSWVGYIMIVYGIVGSIVSVVGGILLKWIGRFALFIFGVSMNALCITFIYLWTPSSDEKWIFFVVTIIWGAADVILMVQLSGLYAQLFPENQEAAFSNLRLWQSVGFAIAYAYSNFLCTWLKTTILGCVLGIGACGYVAVESHLRQFRRDEKQEAVMSKSVVSDMSEFLP